VRVLAADVGGTKAALAVVEVAGSSARFERIARYSSAQHRNLDEILQDFLSRERRPPRFAGLGVAGPVRNGYALVTKLSWKIAETGLSRRFPKTRFRLVNDFVANAMGLPYLKPRQVRSLSRGRPERGGPIALLGAGTGLGQAGLLRVGGRYEPVPSEGGHKDFAPRNEREERLAAFLRARFGRAEWDRVLSGEGLVHIYDCLLGEGVAPEGAAVAEAFREESDPAAVISRFGERGADPLCREALFLFVSLYGSEAGNVALQYRATGGLYVAGGIAPRILPAIERGPFLESFRNKPPLAALLEQIPVRVVLEERLGLYGAAGAAYWMAMEATRPSSKTTERFRTR